MNGLKAQETVVTEFDRLWDFSHPDQSESKFRGLLPELKEGRASDPSSLVELLSQIARAQALQDKLPEAEKTLNEAEMILEQTGSSCRPSAKIRFLLEKGRMLYLAKTPALARPLFMEAWTLAIQTNENYHAIDVAQMMSVIESPKAQRDWTLKALELAESSSQPRVKQWLGSLYSTLGSHFYDLRQYDKSFEAFKKAVEFLEVELGNATQDANIIKRIIVAKWSMGKTLRAQNRIDDALKIQEDLLAELSRSGRKDGQVFEELAECLTLLKRTSEAEVYYELAHTELSKDEWMINNKPEKIKRLKTLGKVRGP